MSGDLRAAHKRRSPCCEDEARRYLDIPEGAVLVTEETLAAALHECYCHRNLPMHSAPDHSAAAILRHLREGT